MRRIVFWFLTTGLIINHLFNHLGAESGLGECGCGLCHSFPLPPCYLVPFSLAALKPSLTPFQIVLDSCNSHYVLSNLSLCLFKSLQSIRVPHLLGPIILSPCNLFSGSYTSSKSSTIALKIPSFVSHLAPLVARPKFLPLMSLSPPNLK